MGYTFAYFIGKLIFYASLLAMIQCNQYEREEKQETLNSKFFIQSSELKLAFRHPTGARSLSFRNNAEPAEIWKKKCRSKLSELLGISKPYPCNVYKLRYIEHNDVTIHALVMEIDDKLSIPCYLLEPKKLHKKDRAVIAIHGHGDLEPLVGLREDYHHSFALELAKAGYLVLCPELRGFGALKDLALEVEGSRLDYRNKGKRMVFSLVTEGFLHGYTLIGQTIEDLLRWENFLYQERGIEDIDVVGISYGGDLALTYPVFSQRVRKIFASGTLGSFSVIFSRGNNAPAHCIPGILEWMDRSDIAGLNAPRPLTIQYGALDKPSPENLSASFNETVEQSVYELRQIYKAFGAEQAIKLVITPDKKHEMDNHALLEFLEH